MLKISNIFKLIVPVNFYDEMFHTLAIFFVFAVGCDMDKPPESCIFFGNALTIQLLHTKLGKLYFKNNIANICF